MRRVDESIRTDRHKRKILARLSAVYRSLACKKIARFTDWADHVNGFMLIRRDRTWNDLVVRIIQGRTKKVGHRCVHDDEFSGAVLLAVKNSRDEHSGVGNDRPARFKPERTTEG